MGFEDDPRYEDEHAECRAEIARLLAQEHRLLNDIKDMREELDSVEQELRNTERDERRLDAVLLKIKKLVDDRYTSGEGGVMGNLKNQRSPVQMAQELIGRLYAENKQLSAEIARLRAELAEARFRKYEMLVAKREGE